MNGTNKRIVFGRLGKNPELKYTKEQTPVCTFTLAENTEGREAPNWHNIVVWGKQAEQCNLYLKKGLPIFVHGQKHTRDYTNRKGEAKQFSEFKADTVGFTFS
jgi:single-strand DNA-binding protein